MKSRTVGLLGWVALSACQYERPTDESLVIEVLDTADTVADAGASETMSSEMLDMATGGMDAGYEGGTSAIYGVTRKPGRFYADGRDLRTVRISFAGAVSAGKPLTVTTSLGIINPAAEAAGRRSLALKSTNGGVIEFPLYAERTSGPGSVTVEGPNGSRAVDDFYIEPLTEQLSIGRSAGNYVADGKQTITLTLGLTSADRSFRRVTVKTTHGILSPDKKDELARSRDIQLAPQQPAEVEWALGSVAGTAVLTAEFGDVLAPPSTVVIAPEPVQEATLTLTPREEEALADGVSVVPIDVDYAAPKGRSDTVTLTTTLGVLNPAGTSIEARRATTVTVYGGRTSKVNLGVGQTPGRATLTARAASVSDVAESLVLKPAPPERLTLDAVDGTVFDAARRELELSVRIARSPGGGRVSEGTSVELLACCLDGSDVTECDEFVTIPSFVTDDNGDGRETTTVALTPQGKEFVDSVASGPIEQEEVTVYAYAREAGATAKPDCTNIQDIGTSEGVVVSDRIGLALEQKPSPPEDEEGP